MQKIKLDINIGLVALAGGLVVVGILGIQAWKEMQTKQLKELAVQGCVETNWNEYADSKAGSLVRVTNDDGVKLCLKLKGY